MDGGLGVEVTMSGMRPHWIVGLAGLVVLGVPIALAVVLKGDHHTASPVTPVARPASGSAIVLARQDGDDALTLAVDGDAIRVRLLGSQGKGVDGRDVSVAGSPTTSCGEGCYLAQTSARGTVPVVVDGRRFDFAIPRSAPDAGELMKRASTAFRSLRSATYVERLASSTRNHIVTTFTLEAPNRIEYQIHGGAAGIVIGTRRWDRTGKKWSESATTPLPQPSPPWGTPVTNAHVLARTRRTVMISFLNPGIPAWFEARFDAHTMLPRRLDMVAVSHFMHHVYTAYNRPRRIFPPR
jgi:hypothetical protein